MFASPPRTSGKERFGGYTVRILDGPSFYIQFKDEFIRRIYHFESSRPDPLIIDGGGNIGMSVLYFKSIYPAARIVCFEPDPTVFNVLTENVEGNHLNNVTLVNAGLGGEAGMVAFEPDGSDGGRTAASGRMEVRMERLSAHLSEPVDFLKLNIEGEELPVLQDAATNGLLRNVREMVVEYHGWPGGDQRLDEILAILDRHRFRYLVHDFDAETNDASKPPFRLRPDTPWFCLVYARRTDD